jgi:glucan biosynthesis protein C
MSPTTTRLPWIDHLRTFVILLVVTQHACVTYSHVGSWYLMSAQEPGMLVKIIFIFWQAHMQAFFMGLMFFIAGYFAEISLRRRTPAQFFRERLFRLGLPTLFFMAVIHPFIVLGLNPWGGQRPEVIAYYTRYISTGRFISASGPLWFAFALLIFSGALAAWRALRPSPSPLSSSAAKIPTLASVCLLGSLLAGVTFLVRVLQPLGTSILNFQLCYFPAYIALFWLGLHAARHGWLLPLAASPLARRSRRVTLIGSPIMLALLLVVGGPLNSETMTRFNGGWHFEALGLSAWEQFAGIGLSLALISFFSRRVNISNVFATWLSDRAFGVYVFHTPVLIALTMLYRPLEPGNALALAALLTITGLIASFLVADLARRIPGLRSIL